VIIKFYTSEKIESAHLHYSKISILRASEKPFTPNSCGKILKLLKVGITVAYVLLIATIDVMLWSRKAFTAP
jgi:hypothetical protein